MHPEYALVNVNRDIARKSDRVYVINVHGAGEHFCLNKGAAHSRSSLFHGHPEGRRTEVLFQRATWFGG